jgi:hypothetical protein
MGLRGMTGVGDTRCMTATRKTTMNIEAALADPTTIYGNQTSNKTVTVVSVRRTKTGRPVVTFSDGRECRYTGREDVIVVRPASNAPLSGKPTHTGAFRGWNRY